MTVMEDKLREAGVKIKPQTQRVWEWFRDNPDHTAQQAAAALKMKPQTVWQLVYLLKNRGVVSGREEVRRETSKRGARRPVWVYRAVGQNYSDILPLYVQVKEKPQRPANVVVTQNDLQKPAPKVEAPKSATLDIESMTVREARSLYERLHSMFGAR